MVFKVHPQSQRPVIFQHGMLSERKRIAFILYHGTGHFNACFHLARKFNTDHEVVFVGVEYFKRYVEVQGFTYYPLQSVPFGLNLENWVNEIKKKKFIWWQTLKDRWNDSLYLHREAEFKKFITEFKPDYILLDSLQSTDFIVLYPLMKNKIIRLGFISTTFPLQLRPDEPALNSVVLPNSKGSVMKSNRSVRIRQWWRYFVQNFRYAGMNDLQIIQRRLKRNNIPVSYLPTQSLFAPAFQNIPEFILASRELNFPTNEVLPYQHYLGLQIDHNRTESTDPDFLKDKALIFKKIIEEKSKLIYCSFGTTPFRERISVLQLLSKIIQATKNHRLLISFQATAEEHRTLLNGYSHAYIFKTLPQLEILSCADVFITHGGLNSIKESIDAGVPMLVYLTETRRDQPGNAARVQFHKIGIKGKLTDSAEKIHENITKLLTGDYKQRLAVLQGNDSPLEHSILDIMDSYHLV